jgi:hypothetical protein
MIPRHISPPLRLAASLMLFAALHASKALAEPPPFGITVVDLQTGRGVPVELETMDDRLHVADSAGRLAFPESGRMAVPLWFSLRWHGIEFPTDGIGMSCQAIASAPAAPEAVRAGIGAGERGGLLQ